MADGIVKQITGIEAPIDDNYILTVIATYIVDGNAGGDWGSAFISKLFMTQNGSTTYGDEVHFSTSRLPFAIQYSFALDAGYTIDCGLYCDINGAVECQYYDVKIKARIAKR